MRRLYRLFGFEHGECFAGARWPTLSSGLIVFPLLTCIPVIVTPLWHKDAATTRLGRSSHR